LKKGQKQIDTENVQTLKFYQNIIIAVLVRLYYTISVKGLSMTCSYRLFMVFTLSMHFQDGLLM